MIHIRQLGIKRLIIILSFFHSFTYFSQKKNEEVEKIFEKTGFNMACQFSLQKKIDSTLIYCSKALDLGLLPEIIIIHPDLEYVRNDSAAWSIVMGEVYKQYLSLYPSVSKPKIGFELFQLYALDQKDRTLKYYKNFSYSLQKDTFSIEKHNIEIRERISKTTEIIDNYGWLGYSEVGKKSGDALFLIIQHSYPEDNLLKKYLPLLINSALNNEADIVNAANMIDRFLFRTKGVQMYGTQA
jgi:hypothetical protein